MTVELVEAIQTGLVCSLAEMTKVKELVWDEHPVFAGVALKHLVTGQQTEGKFSSHLVRVAAGCEIGNHIHKGKWELHEVIKGNGRCRIESKEVEYINGITAIIPADLPHSVKAGNEDLYILAKFVPALL